VQHTAKPVTASGQTAAKWTRIQDLFYKAAELPAAERAAFLATACPDEPSLRIQVSNLVAAIEEDGAITGRVQRAAESVLGSSEPDTGERIGPYEIVRLIGRGGMGAVYLATRADDQFRKQVAIKTMRFGGSPELLQRFRAERQILANMEHPNIARLLDGGVTSSGLPYLVMDFVEGVTITAYCEGRALALRDRLRLFQQVCSAVQYAHTNLVIHRDLKPANISVTADGTPKLLDFGIAKLLDHTQIEAGTAATVADERLMTPDYASPEQVRGEPVVTATDVYSLGVVLYELLTRVLPFQLRGATAAEVERIVCGQDPVKPSAAASASLTKLERRALAGDLDNIVMMALSKDPARRYPSVWHLNEDVTRYLSGYPVQARQDSWVYRTRKFVARRRLGVASAVTAVVLVMAFVIALIWERNASDRERVKAQEVTRLMLDLFRVSDPSESRGETVTAREVMDRGAERMERELSLQPELRATMLHTIADVYRQLGLYPRSLDLAQQSLVLRRQILSPTDSDTIRSVISIGQVLSSMGKYQESEERLREALSLIAGRGETQSVLAAETWQALGYSLQRLGRMAEAEAAHTEAVKIFRKTLGPESAEAGEAVKSLAITVFEAGDARKAEPHFREASRIRLKARGPTDPTYGAALLGLANSLARQGRDPEAEPLFQQVLELYRKLYGNSHVETAGALNDLAAMYGESGVRRADAVATHRQALAAFRAAVGEEHPLVANSLNNLAVNLMRARQYPEAEKLGTEALRMNQKLLGDDHPNVTINLSLLAVLAERRYDYAAAEMMFRDVLAKRLRLSPQNPLLLANTRFNLASILAARGNFIDAEPLYEATLAYFQANVSTGSRRIPATLAALSDCRSAQGKREAAERAGREAVAAARNIKGDIGTASLATALASLGRTLMNAEQQQEAAQLLRQARDLTTVKLSDNDMYHALTLSALGRALAEQREFVEARKLLEDAAVILRQNKHAFARAELERNLKVISLLNANRSVVAAPR